MLSYYVQGDCPKWALNARDTTFFIFARAKLGAEVNQNKNRRNAMRKSEGASMDDDAGPTSTVSDSAP